MSRQMSHVIASTIREHRMTVDDGRCSCGGQLSPGPAGVEQWPDHVATSVIIALRAAASGPTLPVDVLAAQLDVPHIGRRVSVPVAGAPPLEGLLVGVEVWGQLVSVDLADNFDEDPAGYILCADLPVTVLP